MTAEDVKKNLLALPWVKPVKGDVQCEGIKWNTVAMKDLYPRGTEPARGFQPRSRCKRKAKFIFRATKRVRKYEPRAVSGAYCTTHASMQITDNAAERRRAVAWWDKNGWWLNGVFGNHSEVV